MDITKIVIFLSYFTLMVKSAAYKRLARCSGEKDCPEFQILAQQSGFEIRQFRKIYLIVLQLKHKSPQKVIHTLKLFQAKYEEFQKDLRKVGEVLITYSEKGFWDIEFSFLSSKVDKKKPPVLELEDDGTTYSINTVYKDSGDTFLVRKIENPKLEDLASTLEGWKNKFTNAFGTPMPFSFVVKDFDDTIHEPKTKVWISQDFMKKWEYEGRQLEDVEASDFEREVDDEEQDYDYGGWSNWQT